MSNSFGDRNSELQAFKKIDLRQLAGEYGFVVDKKETTRLTTMMRRHGEKIGITEKGGIWLYCSNATGQGGTAVEFAQTYIEPGANLGRVRQLLRPYIGNSDRSPLQERYDRTAAVTETPAAAVDYLGIASRVSRFEKVNGHNAYLCNERGIPGELLQHPRVRGRVLYSPRHGSIIFPHYGTTDDNPKSLDRCLNGYEIKGPGVNFFSKNGRKGLFCSSATDNDTVLAVAESGLDALSYLALNDVETTRIVSIAGQLNKFQPELLKSAIGKMGQGSVIVSCVDNDPAGDKLTEAIGKIVAECGRDDVEFKEHRPEQRGNDWNDVLRRRLPPKSLDNKTNPSLRR